jgi:hypothetical protein
MRAGLNMYKFTRVAGALIAANDEGALFLKASVFAVTRQGA